MERKEGKVGKEGKERKGKETKGQFVRKTLPAPLSTETVTFNFFPD
jgi:hypothetical protein